MNERTTMALDSAEEQPVETRSPWIARLGIVAFLLLAVAAGSYLRVQMTLNDPGFNPQEPSSMLKSDPGLLFYITERIVDSGGLPPQDFRADPNIEYPGESDIPAMFSVGQEFAVAWAYLLFGDATPLHIVALWLMALCASLSVLGVFGLGYELSGRRVGWAMLAAGIYLILQGNYRTVGFVLIREDFSIPWLSLHLYLLVRALRVRTRLSVFWAALFFVLAAATWHAMGFMLTIEAAVILFWFLRSGQNPLAHENAWVFPITIVLGSLLVPVLLAKGFLFSLPVLFVLALWSAAQMEKREGTSTRWVRLSAPITLIALVAASFGLSWLTGGGRADYSHVFELMSSKLAHLGQLPQDPTNLSFDTRLLWQGPFSTPDWTYFHGAFGASLVVLLVCLVWGARGWIRGAGDPRLMCLVALIIGGVVAALLVRRTVVLPALLVPVVAAVALERLRSAPAQALVLVLFLGYQLPGFYNWITSYQCPWYQPVQSGQELAEVLSWIDQNIPADEPICSDFLTGTAVLAHSRNPMLVQPKYETTSSRRRIETFMDEFMNGDLEGFRALLDENDCRFVLTNQEFWRNNAYVAGIEPKPNQMPDPRTPYFNFCHPDLRVSGEIPGFELVFSSPNLFGRGIMRVYRKGDSAGG